MTTQAIVATFETELNLTEKGFAELVEKKKGLLIDVSTDAGFKEARKERTEQNSILKDIDRLAIDGKNSLDDARSTLKVRVSNVFKPIVDAFEAEDTKRKLAKKKAEDDESDRVKGIKDEIAGIRQFAIGINGKQSSEISEILEAVDMIDVSVSFSEFTQEAMSVKKEVIGELNLALSSAIQNEQLLAAQNKLKLEQEQQDAANKAQDRLNKLMMIPIGMMGKSSEEIGSKVLKVVQTEINQDEFGLLFEQAKIAKDNVVNQLNGMFDQQVLVEKSQVAQNTTDQVAEPFIESTSEQKSQTVIVRRSPVTTAPLHQPKLSECELKMNTIRKQVDFWAREYNVGDTAIRDLMPMFEKLVN